MLKGHQVKIAYSEEFFFDNIEEASVFVDQAIRHSKTEYRWASIEPVYDKPVQDDNEEVAEDD
jgi:aminopeptidase C